MYSNWQPNNIDQQLLNLALQEDLNTPFCDVTTQTIFSDSKKTHSVQIVSKSKTDIVVCGLVLIPTMLNKLTGDFQLDFNYQDGDILKSGELLLTLSGDANLMLMAERTLLNFTRHLSAIATLTRRFVDLIRHTHTKILDTRKTTPGMRHLEKYAVHCGGGVNHRMGLYDAYMIKDTHIDLIGGIEKALAHIPDKSQNKLPVILEIRNINELEIAIEKGRHKVTQLLLDNMTLIELRHCVKLVKNIFTTEASGNITYDTILPIAETGVDFASVGMLTYGAGQVDLSMQGIKS